MSKYYNLLMLAIMVGCTAESRADVLYSSFGTDSQFDPVNTWGVDAGQSVAGKFSLQSNSQISSLTLALQSADLGSTFGISLKEAAGNLPGANIANWSVTVPKTSGFLATINLSIPITVGSGSYYLVATNPSTGLSSAWYRNSLGAIGNIAFNRGGGWFATNDTQVAFRVEGASLVPEPSTLLVLTSCTMGLAFFRKLRSKPHRQF